MQPLEENGSLHLAPRLRRPWSKQAPPTETPASPA